MSDARTPAKKKPATRAAKAIAGVRSTATKAADATGNVARDAIEKTAAGIEANPLAVLAGGIALGVVAGAFVPRSVREATLLAPVGKRLAETARGAVDAAKDTAKSELDVLGLSRNAARDQVGKLLGEVIKALSAAGTAALTAATAAKVSADPAPEPAAKRPTSKKAKREA